MNIGDLKRIIQGMDDDIEVIVDYTFEKVIEAQGVTALDVRNKPYIIIE